MHRRQHTLKVGTYLLHIIYIPVIHPFPFLSVPFDITGFSVLSRHPSHVLYPESYCQHHSILVVDVLVEETSSDFVRQSYVCMRTLGVHLLFTSDPGRWGCTFLCAPWYPV
jgi:hypothetical protein